MKNIASRLSERIELQTLTETSDLAGGFTSEWATTATLWAEAKPLRGAEIFMSEKIIASNDYIFTIRYFQGITTKMRIRFKSRLFNIRSIINPMENGEMLEIYAEELLAD